MNEEAYDIILAFAWTLHRLDLHTYTWEDVRKINRLMEKYNDW